MVKQLTAVPGVESVRPDVQSQTAKVTPKANKAPSPRALWEAVEKAGFKPTKLEGPGGKFTAKPKS